MSSVCSMNDDWIVYASDKALSMQEVLGVIFAELDPSTCFAASLVCWSWYGPATNELWKVVHSPFPLFQILGPLKSTAASARSLQFENPLTAEDWDRFLPFAQRVRQLTYSDAPHRMSFDASVFREIALSRSIPCLLPGLRTLFLDIKTPWRLHRVVMFLLPTLTQARVTIHCPNAPELPYFIGELPRASRLKNLQVCCWLTTLDTVAALQGALNRLKCLEAFSFYGSGKTILPVFGALSMIPTLQYLSVRRAFEVINGTPLAALTSEGKAEFPKLKILSIDSYSLHYVSQAVCSFFFSALQELEIRVASHSFDPQQIHQLLSSLENVCPSLVVLNLTFESSTFESTPPPLDFITIEPISNLRCLHTLRLLHPYPILLSQAEITRLALALGPLIEVLMLNPNPTRWRVKSPSLTMSALLPIATHCRRLRHLGLYLDATFPIPTPSVSFSKALQDITFGASLIQDHSWVVNILVDMACPRVHRDGAPDPGTYSHQLCWAFVVVVLDSARRVDALEKAKLQSRIEELSRENMELRAELDRL